MYTGTNPKALHSIQTLKDCLYQQMQSVPYHEITIKDLCQEADISRQTFYTLIETKDQLLGALLDDLFEPTIENSQNKKQIPIMEAITFFMEVMDSKKKFLKLLLDNQLQNFFMASLQNACLRLTQLSSRQLTKSDLYMLHYHVGGVTNLLTYWYQDGFSLSKKEMTALMSETLFYDRLESSQIFVKDETIENN